jgi:hypothetical protein
MKAQPYKRDPNGLRIDFHGMDTLHPPDEMPPNKYPFAQNIRRNLKGRTTGRPTQSTPVLSLASAPHSMRRLNDTTPDGPPQGYIVVSGASTSLYANSTPVDTGFSGNPISLVPFRPNASVQPWMYVGDSLKMDKVNSGLTCYKMGVKEPQAAPAVTFVPASDTVSLLGAVTVYYFNNPTQSHSAPLEGVYIWKNASDPVGGSSVVETTGDAIGSAQGTSLLFDYDSGGSPDISGVPSTPVAWTQYTTYTGTVTTNGTSVTWASGDQFGGLSSGDTIVISGTTYTITGGVTNTTLSITASAGQQTAVSYSAAVITGTVPLFVPALESEGYQDFNCSILATLYIPAAGTYTLSLTAKDDILWGIGNSASGTATWPGPTAGETLSTIGQTITTINGYQLMPRTYEANGEDNNYTTASVAVTFSAAGNYPLEIDWDYWYHVPRGLAVLCNGALIPPIPASIITDSQYRYTYRSSATGATSNPSPESAETALSVLANNVTATQSTDPQVDKIDFYRLDAGLENFTYVGTVENALLSTVTLTAVTSTGVGVVNIPITRQINVGEEIQIDTGGNAEVVTVLAFTQYLGLHPEVGVTANFANTHAAGVPFVAVSILLNDTLLDTDIASNPILDFDNFEPFPSIDLPSSGVVNVVFGTVVWQSGDVFNVRWLPGTVIIIGTVAYTLNTRPTSTTMLTATNVQSVGGIETVVVPPSGQDFIYEIAEPILAAQPMPYLWGPTDNVSFFFGVGDPLRPGTLYWCKGNNPDSAPDTNQQDVTSPSEPLINGVIVNGIGLVMSSERGFLIYPNFFNALATVEGTAGSTWTIQESIQTRGLYMPRCITVDGGGNVFFRGKDGVYLSPGGQGAKSITDEDIYNLFPHEGLKPSPVTRAGFTVYPPDDTQPQAQKMNVADGYLYYDYLDVTSTARTLVFDIAAMGWVWDVYQYPVSVHMLEEGPNVNGVLCGCFDGNARVLVDSGPETCTSVLMLPCFNAGDTRAEKRFGDLYIEAGGEES